MTGDPRYNTPAWRQLRRVILTRDNHQCQMQLNGCTQTATTVDHKTPVSLGGPFYDPTNLQAACPHCNYSAGGRLGQRQQQRTYPQPLNW